MTKQDLVQAIANALETTPDEILIYRPVTKDNYTVILMDYRKFNDVRPLYAEPEPQPEQPEQPTIIEETRVNLQGTLVPAELADVYTHPKNHNRTDLRDLAAYLEIPKARTMNKRPLIKAIQQYKAEHNPLSVEQANEELFS
jgi:hypothetical protein